MRSHCIWSVGPLSTDLAASWVVDVVIVIIVVVDVVGGGGGGGVVVVVRVSELVMHINISVFFCFPMIFVFSLTELVRC